MKTQAQKRKEGKGLAKFRWGESFVVTIFPVKKDKLHRITLRFKGKEYSFGGQNRLEVLDKVFEFARELNENE